MNSRSCVTNGANVIPDGSGRCPGPECSTRVAFLYIAASSWLPLPTGSSCAWANMVGVGFRIRVGVRARVRNRVGMKSRLGSGPTLGLGPGARLAYTSGNGM